MTRKMLKALRKLIRIVVALSLGAPVAMASAKAPWIVASGEGFNRCADPEPACPGRLLKIQNPLPKYVQVVVRCSHDGTSVEDTVIVFPRKSVVLDLGTDKPLGPSDCRILTWKVWNGPGAGR